MTAKKKIQITADMLMTVMLPLLMAYSLIGETTHEWLGISMFLLFLLHQALNWKWYKSLVKGKYNAVRILGTVVNISIFLLMIALMISGIINSKVIFSDWNIQANISLARTVHMAASYWCFVFSAVHLGLHFGMLTTMFRKVCRISKDSAIRKTILRFVALGISGYGIYAFFHRQLGTYMILHNQYVFFDFSEPIVLFILDYVTIMCLFAAIGYYFKYSLTKLVQRR